MKRLLLVAALLLAASQVFAEAPQLEFKTELPSDLRAKIEKLSPELWLRWEKSVSVETARATLDLSFLPSSDFGALAGRSRGTSLQFSDRLDATQIESVLAHELAHAFLSVRCPLATPSEFFAESFALWLSKDDQRLIARSDLSARRFVLSSNARHYLQDRLSSVVSAISFHEVEPAQALARQIAESRRLRPSGPESLEILFRKSLGSCELDHQPLSVALLGTELQSPLSVESVVVVDGLSGETLLSRGRTDELFPTASLLKPYFLAMHPEARVNRLSKGNAEWSCPTAKGGELWSWQRALFSSCNGFFLDTPEPGADFWKNWRETLKHFGFAVPDTTQLNVARAIGLLPGVEASVTQLASLYRWLSEHQPEVADALLETPKTGTLARLPDSNWFSKNRIALKSGTIRNEREQPEHGWIVALGPRTSEGKPAFVAALHQRGSSPQILLGRLRAHLETVYGSKIEAPSSLRVQVLGLFPRAALRARCEGAWVVGNSVHAGDTVDLFTLKEGERRRCASGPMQISFPRAGGFEERSYWGTLIVSRPPSSSTKVSKVEVSTAQLRARQGSELILETSTATYVAGVLASEFGEGRSETLKALAMVSLYNATHSKHAARPVCDTTHCQVYGPRGGEAKPGARISKIARELGDARIVKARGTWLSFSAGGKDPWEKTLRSETIERKLKLPQGLFEIELALNNVDLKLGANGDGLRKRFGCEQFRNTLKLPSCPGEVSREGKQWKFVGSGEGHGEGLDLRRADAMAAEGREATEILRTFYPGVQIRQ